MARLLDLGGDAAAPDSWRGLYSIGSQWVETLIVARKYAAAPRNQPVDVKVQEDGMINAYGHGNHGVLPPGVCVSQGARGGSEHRKADGSAGLSLDMAILQPVGGRCQEKFILGAGHAGYLQRADVTLCGTICAASLQ